MSSPTRTKKDIDNDEQSEEYLEIRKVVRNLERMFVKR